VLKELVDNGLDDGGAVRIGQFSPTAFVGDGYIMLTQKDVVLNHLDAVIATVSGDGEFQFNHRQLFYALRPIVMEEMDRPPPLPGNST
jgi:hypothetical protein